MEQENSYSASEPSSVVSAAELMSEALAKGKIAQEKRRIIKRNDEPKAKSFLPNWITVCLAIVGALDLSKNNF